MQKTIPDHSPLIASNCICSGCGDVIRPAVVKNMRGDVSHLHYEHRNKEVGCAYSFDTNAMVNAEMKAMRPDGTEVKL